MTLTESAPAKVNLTLQVLGRRSDGFHELESLVAFARLGDTLTLAPGDGLSLEFSGPFAAALGKANLVLEAAERVLDTWPAARAGAFHLTKRLPVAAGLGGGSADAAAALRLLARANPGVPTEQGLNTIATALGADVPVCLASCPAMVRGVGELVCPLDGFPPVGIVLANPGVALATGDVFDALGAPALSSECQKKPECDDIKSLKALIDTISDIGNDLEVPAVRLAAGIAELKAALAAAQGCLTAGMSGSGATCFALFETGELARSAAEEVRAEHTGWWVEASVLQ